MLIHADQRDRRAFAARPAGAADTVDVIFGDVRQFKIHDMRQLLDIETARRQIGRDQDAHIALFEIGQRLRTRALAFVAVNGGRANAVLFELLAEAVRAVLGARKHKDLTPVLRRDQKGK